jgi:O-antigen ligase
VAHMQKFSVRVLNWQGSYRFWLLVSFLILVFFTGGGSRHDVQSLIILRPAAALMCGIALLTLTSEQMRAYRVVFSIAAATFCLVLLHLIPLPPALWHYIPGREILIEVDRISGIGDQWRPIAMIPSLAWNAFFALFVPLAVLLHGVQLTLEERFRLLPVLLGLGLLSGFWGLMQVVGAADGPLYLYEQTTNGAAVGLFSNRNHQAALLSCLFPAFAIFASFGAPRQEQVKAKSWLAVACCVFVVPLILVTGSRAGIVTGIIGLACAFLLYRTPQSAVTARRAPPRFDPRIALISLGVLALVALTVIMSRAEALRRLSVADQAEDLRWQMWGPIADMALKYFPFGSGIGSFVQVYQIDEPATLLSPNYVNHAHNDWLEIWLTAGVPGALLLTIAVVAFVRASNASFTALPKESRTAAHARLGAAIIFIFALASVVDYPLRTPSIACICVIAVLWLGGKAVTGTEKAGRL